MEHYSESQVPIMLQQDSSAKISSSQSSISSLTDDKSDKETPRSFYLGDDEDENRRNQLLAHLESPSSNQLKILPSSEQHYIKIHEDEPLISTINSIQDLHTARANGCIHSGSGDASPPHYPGGGIEEKSYPMRTIASSASMSKPPIILHTLSIPRDSFRGDDSAEDSLLGKHANMRRGDLSPSMFPHHHSRSQSHNVSPHSNNSSHFGNRRHQYHHKYSVVPMRALGAGEKVKSKRAGNDALGLVLSALYGKILVVMGIAFPMSEVISTYIPPSFYDGFYLYLYFGSITFMICILGNMLRQKATRSVRGTIKRISTMRSRIALGNSGVAPDVTTTEPQEHSCDSEGSFSESPAASRIEPVGARANMNRMSRVPSENAIDPLSIGEGAYSANEIHFGSFYLRMGAVAFGIGSMIYSGLEFGQYFELEPDTKCHNVLIALTPSVRMIFTFMQMYFVFLNSKMAISKVRLGAQFGLMHMIGTNLCVWLNVLIQETRHEILQFYNPDNNTINVNHGSHIGGTHKPRGGWHGGHGFGHGQGHGPVPFVPQLTTLAAAVTTAMPKIRTTVLTALPKVHAVVTTILPKVHAAAPAVSTVVRNATKAAVNATVHAGATAILHREKRGLKGPHSIYECRRTDIMGALVQNASPFLFPCTIEYSLICAAILYVMWKSMARPRKEFVRAASIYHHGELHLIAGAKRSPHYYSVDCARANKGLFLGIFVLVLTIISLILFFVLITRPGYQALAMLEVNITELVLYTTTTVAVLIGMCQVRELRYDTGRNLELDNILLIVAQTGSFIYNVFTIIGGHFTMKKNTVLVLMTALASLIQLLFQTIFILDASKRAVATADQVRRKPGREVITFLLVTNLAMWSINTLEKSRADSHPVQLRFYGVWAWTIITHISMPLAIFYRFHSTVCLCEIWKRAYKIKQSPSYPSL